jgi:hypothetical protein
MPAARGAVDSSFLTEVTHICRSQKKSSCLLCFVFRFDFRPLLLPSFPFGSSFFIAFLGVS